MNEENTHVQAGIDGHVTHDHWKQAQTLCRKVVLCLLPPSMREISPSFSEKTTLRLASILFEK